VESESRDPRVRSETLYWIDCSACNAADGLRAPRFRSEEDLWHALLTADRGWIRLDDGRVLCPIHRRVAECDSNGHAVTLWAAHPLDANLAWRCCTRCGSLFEQRVVPDPAMPPTSSAS